MKLGKVRYLVLVLVLVISLVGASGVLASASTAKENCEYNAGSWSGSDDYNGTCVFGLGENGCTEKENFVQNWAGNSGSFSVTSSGCVYDYFGVFDTHNPNSTGNSEGPTLNLGGGKNGSATFQDGSCPQQCTISSDLPAGAKGSLPGDAIATLYVRVVDEGGAPGIGSYTVCFDNPDGEALTIYRYVAGVWVAQTINSSNPICTSASGDGAFYLG